jgi:hypothetical protein
MGPLRLLGALFVIILIGVILINILFTIAEKVIEYAETDPLGFSVRCLIILLVLLAIIAPW